VARHRYTETVADLFGPVRTMDEEMPRLAKRYAIKQRWKYTGMEQKPDLFNVLTWRAMFADRRGDIHERSLDDLRTSLVGDG
jgi:hypothetical protein